MLTNVADTTIIYYIFLNAYQGNVTAVRKLTKAFSKGPEYYLRPLVRIAGGEGDSQLLRFCYENGDLATAYPDPDYLLFARVRNQPSVAWLDVLFEFDYRQWRTNPQQLSNQRTWYHVLMMGADCARWWIEHGGRPAKCRGLFERTGNDRRYPEAKTVRVLLDHFGVEWFNDSGALQLAVENHDFETVKMLVEAGADVNEFPTDWNYDVREHRAAPLEALNMAMYAKSDKIIRYLVEHGARLSCEDVSDPYNTLPEEYKPYRNLIVELGAVEDKTPS
jgi:hypothetical protein